MKVDILALSGLLFFSYEKDLFSLTILGDSKVIVDGAYDIHILHTIELHHWIKRVKDLIICFHHISFSHIY